MTSLCELVVPTIRPRGPLGDGGGRGGAIRRSVRWPGGEEAPDSRRFPGCSCALTSKVWLAAVWSLRLPLGELPRSPFLIRAVTAASDVLSPHPTPLPPHPPSVTHSGCLTVRVVFFSHCDAKGMKGEVWSSGE